jgi:uncharacterized protein DUF4145
MEDESVKTIDIYCNRCHGQTRHNLIAKKGYSYGDPEEGPGVWGEYRLWSCAGCDTCTMEDHYTADDMTSLTLAGEERQRYESIFYPKPSGSSRVEKQFVKLPAKLKTIYHEVVCAKNEGLRILCATGLRSLLEGVCSDKGITGNNVALKIDSMKDFLPENIVKNLHAFRFTGNEAVHELEAPPDYELEMALDVIEDVLNFLYALDYKANTLAQMQAARRDKSNPPF